MSPIARADARRVTIFASAGDLDEAVEEQPARGCVGPQLDARAIARPAVDRLEAVLEAVMRSDDVVAAVVG